MIDYEIWYIPADHKNEAPRLLEVCDERDVCRTAARHAGTAPALNQVHNLPRGSVGYYVMDDGQTGPGSHWNDRVVAREAK